MMNRTKELLRLAEEGQLNTAKLYLLVVKATAQEFQTLREELSLHNYTFSIVPDQPQTNGDGTYSLYLTTPTGVYLVANRGKEKWFTERNVIAI
jgi:hypothetical protein